MQDAWLDRRAELDARGVRYVLLGHMQDSAPGVPGFATLGELADYARQNTGKSLLVSNEFMSAAPSAFIDEAASLADGFGVTVIAYIRRYADWTASSYAFDVRAGWNPRDFDRYVEALGDRISYWPGLERWGRAVGWDNMRIRALEPTSLEGGELVSDGFHAVGVDASMAGGARALRSNTAMNWMVVELTRAMVGEPNEAGWDESANLMLAHVQQRLEGFIAESRNAAAAAQYFTPSQARALAELYNEDVGKIIAMTGAPIAFTPIVEVPERPFLPSLTHIPADILARFIAAMRDDPVVERARAAGSGAAAALARLEAHPAWREAAE